MSNRRFVLGMALRESRASLRRLILLMSAISVGVGALVAINGFTDNLERALEQETRSLFGADLSVRSTSELEPEQERYLDSVVTGAGVERSLITGFSAMAYVPGTEGTRLVEVTAIDGGYPWYGKVVTEPEGIWSVLAESGSVLVDPALLTALDALPGDTLALGEARFRIAGTVTRMPGDAGIRALFGPRVWIAGSDVDETGLLQFGSRVDHETFFRFSASTNVEELAEELRQTFKPDGIRVRTARENQENLTDALASLSRYLGLVALTALLLGGLGVASAVHVFIRRKLTVIAILRCLGASAAQATAIYLIQALAMGFIGSLAGVALGIAIQLLLPGILSDFIPVAISSRPSWSAIATGLGVGCWVALVFSLLPLLAVRRISPLAALRQPYEDGALQRRDPLRLAVVGLIAASVVAIAVLQVKQVPTGLAFAGGLGVALGCLAIASLLLMRGLKRWLPSQLPYLWRQGLANLYRPANQTLMVVLALGFGAFLLTTLFLVQANLLREFELGAGVRANVILFGIQPGQRAGVDSLLHASGLPILPAAPIVPMRMESLKGRSAADWLADTVTSEESRPESWAVRREYRSTWRDTLVRSEQAAGGSWPADTVDGRIPVSMETGLAEDLQLVLGDPVDWDVQGLTVPTYVAALREVDWARFEPNFFVVFPSGVLEAAPHSYVTLTRSPSPESAVSIQRKLAERFPNIASIDLRRVQATLEGLLDRVTWAIRFMAAFTLITGAVVLVGAMATSRYQRLREGVLLRALGAVRHQVLRVMLVEYASLGALAILSGMVMSTAAAWGIIHFVFESSFSVPWTSLLTLAATILVLTIGTGLWNSGEALRKTPLEVLRTE